MLDLAPRRLNVGQTALVTGATGLLGSWLVPALAAAGCNPVCLVRDGVPNSRFAREGGFDRFTTVRGDLSDPLFLERVLGEYEVDVVYHLAAQTIVGIANRNPLSTFEANIRGTYHLLEACRRSPRVGRVIVASSDKAYGDQPQLPYREDAPLQGRHPYDVSKSCADLISQSYAHAFGLPVCVTRCGNLYGGGDLNFNRLIPGTIRSILAGEPPIVRSDGLFVRDYFYVEDAVGAYLALADGMAQNSGLAGRAFNFSSDVPATALDVVRELLSRMGSDLEPTVLNQASNEIRDQRLDSSVARAELGWRPEFSLGEGLERTVAWYRDWLAAESRTAVAA